jgi:inorganic phosphate transporter, PiT family
MWEPMLTVIFLIGLMLAFANGSNDNFKCVATLYGSKTLSYKQALILATLVTLAGSLIAIYLSSGLLKSFSGKDIVAAELVNQWQFVLATVTAAGAVVLMATRLAMPVSTTHSLIGAIVGSGLAHSVVGIHGHNLLMKFAIPLVLSPFIAITTAMILSPLIVRCIKAYHFGPRIADKLHIMSAGLVGFSRGLNDAPKIAALLFVSGSMLPLEQSVTALIIVSFAMAAGGILNGRKVAETMSTKIIDMDHSRGFSANLVTGTVVFSSSLMGLPVSTTHVACGSIMGLGKTNRRTVQKMVGAWVITLPLAAGIAFIVYSLLMLNH